MGIKVKTGLPNDRVKVWIDPMTKKKLEGTATLVKCVRPEDGFGCQTWLVRFDNKDYREKAVRRDFFYGMELADEKQDTEEHLNVNIRECK